MTAVNERVALVCREMERAGIEALVCGLPTNVLLLSGYWPVVGTAVAVASRAGGVGLIVPEDERGLAEAGWADDLQVMAPASPFEPRGTLDLLREPLAACLRALHLASGVVGIETGPVYEPSSYAAFNLYGESLRDALRRALPAASLRSANEQLVGLRSRLTSAEQSRVRLACNAAGQAFVERAAHTRAGMSEVEIASALQAELTMRGIAAPGVRRAGGFVFCMSGAGSGQAYGSHAWSTGRAVQRGELALIHCNSYADGYWTDITRTYCLGEPDSRHRRMYEAVLAARAAALEAVRPGAPASGVDGAARRVLETSGFARAFKHATGHGVGFAAIDHDARPRVGPKSDDVLQEGMVFNVEPAIYLDGAGGLRHCDMVAVTASGAELMTPFQATLDHLILDA